MFADGRDKNASIAAGFDFAATVATPGLNAPPLGAPCSPREPLRLNRSGPPAEVALQRPDFEIARKIGFYALRCRDGT
jgi:hypothetical protein